VVVVSAAAGFFLGRRRAVRAVHGLIAGLLTAFTVCGARVLRETTRGYAPEGFGQVLINSLSVAAATVPVMTICVTRSALGRDSAS
jgi:hypothetical protein